MAFESTTTRKKNQQQHISHRQIDSILNSMNFQRKKEERENKTLNATGFGDGDSTESITIITKNGHKRFYVSQESICK